MDEQKGPPPGWRVVSDEIGTKWEHVLCGRTAFVGDMTEVYSVNRALEHRAFDADATDEERIMAGWVQEVAHGSRPPDGVPSVCGEPAPGPAGRWRLHASGVWVRWVVPVGGAR
jgi:hypothetical protein